MSEEKLAPPAAYKIKDIHLLHFKIIELDDYSIIDKEKLAYQIGYSFSFIKGKNIVKVVVDMTAFEPIENDEKRMVAEIKTNSNFEIVNFPEVFIEDKGTGGFSGPMEVLQAFFGMAGSTTRGMFLMCTSSSSIGSIIYPAIQAKSINVVRPESEK